MSILYNGDCNEWMSEIEDESVDLIFTDLPYGQTSIDWDKKIDLVRMWEHFMRIKKTHTPIFFCCSTKFGVELILSAPKKCQFRYDIVWVKSAPVGFLSSRRMPLRKHEMLYVFYEHLPLYDLSSHKHKFVKEGAGRLDKCYFPKSVKKKDEGKGDNVYSKTELYRAPMGKYDPPLPTSVQKEPEQCDKPDRNTIYGNVEIFEPKRKGEPRYDPPLPTSVLKEPYSTIYNNKGKTTTPLEKHPDRSKGDSRYDPPLPTSVQKEPEPEPHAGDSLYSDTPPVRYAGHTGGSAYDPPLPTSVMKETKNNSVYGDITTEDNKECGGHQQRYDPALPTTILEVKSQKCRKHSTQKPVDLMKWVLKYYSKEEDVILDPTMGSGSTGVACQEMNRNFIGIEMDPEIFEYARERIEG